MTATDELPSLLHELREHGADRRTASPALRAAFADLTRQAATPNFFVSDSIAAAVDALAADDPRFQAAREIDRRTARRRCERDTKRRDRLNVQTATCCINFYTRSAADHSWWPNCRTCHRPLVYVSTRAARG